jgi:branched-chain amino acid aminotransferase
VAGNLGQGKTIDRNLKENIFMRTIYLDGQFLKASAQIIDAFTPGVFKAKGVFETMLGLDGIVLDTALHISRLRAGLKVLGVKMPSIDPSALREVLRCNQLLSARVRLMVWQAGKETHVLITALPYKVSEKPMYRVCLMKTNRTANDLLSNVKSLDYEVFAKAYSRAQAQGFDEALLMNRQGHIFEASRGNIFWMKDGVLYTPPLSSGCLNGITRQQVIKQAKSMKIPVEERKLTLDILKRSDAAFLTNSLAGIKPIEVTSIKNISID